MNCFAITFEIPNLLSVRFIVNEDVRCTIFVETSRQCSNSRIIKSSRSFFFVSVLCCCCCFFFYRREEEWHKERRRVENIRGEWLMWYNKYRDETILNAFSLRNDNNNNLCWRQFNCKNLLTVLCQFWWKKTSLAAVWMALFSLFSVVRK